MGCPNLTAMGSPRGRGKGIHRGSQQLCPFMLGKGDGGATLHLPPGPTFDTPIPAVGQLRALPSIRESAGGVRGEQEAPEPPHCPYKDSTAPELLPPARTSAAAPHLLLYPTSPSHIPISALLHPTSAPPSPSAPPHAPTSTPQPHINPPHHLPSPHLCPTPSPEHLALPHNLPGYPEFPCSVLPSPPAAAWTPNCFLPCCQCSPRRECSPPIKPLCPSFAS